jgi:hypothetical protein
MDNGCVLHTASDVRVGVPNRAREDGIHTNAVTQLAGVDPLIAGLYM